VAEAPTAKLGLNLGSVSNPLDDLVAEDKVERRGFSHRSGFLVPPLSAVFKQLWALMTRQPIEPGEGDQSRVHIPKNCPLEHPPRFDQAGPTLSPGWGLRRSHSGSSSLAVLNRGLSRSVLSLALARVEAGSRPDKPTSTALRPTELLTRDHPQTGTVQSQPLPKPLLARLPADAADVLSGGACSLR
jgi:hypothetical protein